MRGRVTVAVRRYSLGSYPSSGDNHPSRFDSCPARPARLAQLGERLFYTQEVGGAEPSTSTRTSSSKVEQATHNRLVVSSSLALSTTCVHSSSTIVSVAEWFRHLFHRQGYVGSNPARHTRAGSSIGRALRC